MNNIPKIIHQTWKTYEIPNTMEKYRDSWIKLHPTYTFMFWTDNSIRKFIKDKYPWFLSYFDSYTHQIMRVDVFRMFVLHYYGGIYADLDMEAYKPIDSLLCKGDLLLFLEWPGSISNAIMASVSGHPFWEYCFEKLIEKQRVENNKLDVTKTWELTGPKFLTETLKTYEGNTVGIQIYPSFFYFPIPWHKPMDDQSGKSENYPNSFGAHHWQGTWWQKQPTELRKLWGIIIGIFIFFLIFIFVILKIKK